ncbi:MAG: transcriptional regulator [Bacteroidetes bacterium]|nr:MAG: transcriptional regulator [Bacteroidota bacterium]
MKDRITCIRDAADVDQIYACKSVLKEKEIQISDVSIALTLAGNEARLKILYLIQKERELCVCDLSDILGISVPAVSQHLRKLKDGGLLQKKRLGQTILYSINTEKLHILGHLFALIEEPQLVS